MDVSDEEWDGTVIAPLTKRQKVAVGVPVETVFVVVPEERIVKEKKKRYDQGKKWFDKKIKKGKRVGKNKFGVWRRVPGFPKRTIRVSSKGWVQQWCMKKKEWERPKRGTELANVYYMTIKLRNAGYLVSILINRAFNGAPPSKTHTTDHIAKRPDGDKRKERQDNRAKNLRWLDQTEQSKNRTFSATPYLDDRPLEVFSERIRDGWSVNEWVWFQSQAKAAVAMGVSQASLSNWLSGKYSCSTGWRIRWADHSETQEDLPGTGEAPAYDLAEVWVEINSTFWASNHGRAWRPYRKSTVSRKFTPRATEGSTGYPVIRIGNKTETFHKIVFDAFFPGVRGDRTIDHINRNREDNRLSNLRPATRAEQNCNQTRKLKGDGTMDSQKAVIKYRRADALDSTPWEKCLGVAELARRLTSATGNKYDRPAIGNASHGRYHGTHQYKDYVFYKV